MPAPHRRRKSASPAAWLVRPAPQVCRPCPRGRSPAPAAGPLSSESAVPSLRRLRRVAPSRSDSTESTRRRGGSSAVATSALSTSLAAPHCTTATLVGSPTLKHSVSNGLQHLARSGPGRPLNQPKARTCTVSTKTPQIQNIPRPPPLIRRLRPGGLSRPCHRRPSAANKGHEIAAVRPAQPGRPGCDENPTHPLLPRGGSIRIGWS